MAFSYFSSNYGNFVFTAISLCLLIFLMEECLAGGISLSKALRDQSYSSTKNINRNSIQSRQRKTRKSNQYDENLRWNPFSSNYSDAVDKQTISHIAGVFSGKLKRLASASSFNSPGSQHTQLFVDNQFQEDENPFGGIYPDNLIGGFQYINLFEYQSNSSCSDVSLISSIKLGSCITSADLNGVSPSQSPDIILQYLMLTGYTLQNSSLIYLNASYYYDTQCTKLMSSVFLPISSECTPEASSSSTNYLRYNLSMSAVPFPYSGSLVRLVTIPIIL